MISKTHSVLFVLVIGSASLAMTACKPVKSCSASNCNGCCSEMGQCLAGNGNTACGRGGSLCKACGLNEMCLATTGSCIGGMGTGGGASGTGGGTSSTGGGTSSTGGGMTGGGSGGSGGGAINPDDVEGTCTQSWSSDLDGGTRPCPFGSSPPTAMVISEDGGVLTISAALRADGSFNLANVPMGPYFVKVGTTWLKTTERRISLSYESLGRIDGAMAGASTTLTVNATGMTAWNSTNHFMSLYSSNAGVAMEAFSLYTASTPFGGETSFNFAIPWDLYSTQLATPMLDSTRGDSAIVTQMGADSTGEYRILGAATAGSVAMVSGQANTTTAALTIPPSSNTPLDVNLASFSAAATDFTTGTEATLAVEFNTGPKALHERGADGLAFVWGWYPQAGVPSTLPNPVSYPNPFPSTWGTTVVVQYGNGVSRLATGAVEARRYFSGVTMTLPMQALASPVTSTLSPPKDVQLNGMPFSSAQTAVTRTPTITWTAPSVGTPNRYLLRVEQLQVSQSRTTGRVAAVFYLLPTDTTFTIPPNILLTGQSYVLVLTSFKSLGTVTRDLYDFRFPVASGLVVSGIVRP
ncbi:MAG: hypothetical protein Q8L14_04365 [Myxococcales bacterium]|nr:hypothetical protein [Myxococcales bacterium]